MMDRFTGYGRLGRWAAAACLAWGLTSGAVAAAVSAAETSLFAAASTTNAMQDVLAAFTEATGTAVTPSFASSSTLAKQIEQGAPAEVYVSANPRWMDYLEEAGLLVDETRTDLLGNALVLIAPADSPLDTVPVGAGMDLAALLDGGRLSVGDPDHVPAGMYAEDALKRLGLWATAAPALARANDVRAALALVARGEVPLGIVYATDAAISDGVKVVGTFPEDSHKPITYPAALVADTPAARDLLAFLGGETAAEIFARYGFRVTGAPGQ
ncbi:Molybdenum ABC transporter, periplasmic molybdenum-binding protein ModA [Caenispirillum salinarum AK4]|uniref:Molybdenum ABC transporter, periplasmic molybdenum-binding protein ModA n=1 Tax=Caenispirillum salinarum AK4 TaxID=1238182 RepID=K9H4P1_9PROT|nr:molybdate ABC transporter substrate-binding protein [Caenispirillum salinarum]EKV32049.1 Molybdenum ABC transporter, periplasmic molybdenum-binding protein ModA [Caenispirillum salinarum AK4]